MTARDVVRRIRILDPGAQPIYQTGSHQKWRLTGGCIVIVPIHSGDIPTGTLGSIQRQATACLGPAWLR